MVETILDPSTESLKELDMEEVIDQWEKTVEKEAVVVVAAEAGELIRNRMSKMKEKEEMATAAEAAAGVMMMVEVEVVEVAITGEEIMTRICLHHNPTEEAEAEDVVAETEEETDLQWNATTAKVKVTELENALNLEKKEKEADHLWNASTVIKKVIDLTNAQSPKEAVAVVETEDQWNATTVKAKVICLENVLNPENPEMMVVVVVVEDLPWNVTTVKKKVMDPEIAQNQEKKEVDLQWNATTAKVKAMELEIAKKRKDLEKETMMTVVAIKDNVETMMEIKVGSQTKIKVEAAMEAGVTPFIRLIKITNGVLKDHNLKLKVAGVKRKNRKKKQLVDGMVETRKNPVEEEMTGEIKEIRKTQMIKMEEVAGAEHPFVYKIEIKFTVSF